MKFNKFLMAVSTAALVLGLSVGSMAAAPQMAKSQVLKYNLGAEPEVLDPAKSTGITESVIQYNVFEGLVRLDARNNPVPAVAESWTVSKDGLTYTFKIRKNAKWSDGSAVTANDFEYAWKRLLNPTTASEYAYQAYYLKNGEAYNTGKITDANQVGVKAKDAHTLVATLQSPTSYFLPLLAHTSLLPVKKSIAEGNAKWANDPKTFIGNGPFKMTKWEHNAAIDLVPNPNYWNKKAVKLSKIAVTLVDNPTTELTMFETNQIDFGDNPPTTEMARLKKEGKVKIGAYIGTYYYSFNVKDPVLKNANVRKALTLAIDRQKIVDFITQGGQEPAMAFVPGGMSDIKKTDDFREVGGSYFKDANFKTAKELLAKAGYPDGKGFPTLSILYNTSENHKKLAEAVQEMWKKNLGINVTLRNEEWGVYLTSKDTLNYQVARAGWIGDYPDAMTFMDMFVTDGGNNDTGWSNKKYDELIAKAKSSSDPKVRIKAMHDAEKILMNAYPIAPIYFYTRPYLLKPWVHDVLRSSLGYVEFTKAWISKH